MFSFFFHLFLAEYSYVSDNNRMIPKIDELSFELLGESVDSANLSVDYRSIIFRRLLLHVGRLSVESVFFRNT